MTAHARIKCTIWRDAEFRDLSVDAQWTYQRLLSDSSRNQAGVLALTRRRWAGSAAGMTRERLDAALDELVAGTFVVLDEDTEEVLIRTYIRHNDIALQPNILKAALKQAARVESPLLRSALAHELRLLPEKPADTARMVYPDPHVVAEEIDPGDLAPRLSVVREAPALSDVSADQTQFPKGSANPSDNPSSKTGEQEREQVTGVGGGVGGEPALFHIADQLAVPDVPAARLQESERVNDRDDVRALCARLHDKLILNDYKPTPRITKGWRDQARHLLDIDERELGQALRLIDWALENEFWSTNIASMGKFRQQYPKLLHAAQREHAARKGNAAPTARSQRLEATAAMVARLRREEEMERSGAAITNFSRKALEG